MLYPALDEPARYEQMLDVFLGYNSSLKIQEGEWADMKNISPRAFPAFAPREGRRTVKTLTAPSALTARESLCWVDGATLYINDKAVTGLVLSTAEGMTPKTLVSMGAFLIILPDKKYVNTADTTDYGLIDSVYEYEGEAELTPARVDGTELDLSGVPVTVAPPTNPSTGDYWIDTGGDTDLLKQYSELSDAWTTVPSVFTRISLPGVGAHFEQYDGVKISGFAFDGSDKSMSEQVGALNGDKIIEAVEENAIIVAGLLNRVYQQEEAEIKIERRMPDMDFVIESGNRLWGCKYGLSDGETVNEIYACALGDFKNWRQYRGVSTDSYAVSLGTDGKFTGAVTYQGYPTFFKEMNMHRIYGAMPSQYRVDSMACRGVQDGSHASLAIVNERLYYKGRTEVLCFDGSPPYPVSEALGDVTYREAVGGAYKSLYYLSMKQGSAWGMFMFDTARGLWFKEDATQALCFAQLDDELYYLSPGKTIVGVFGRGATQKEAVDWMAQSGIIGFRHKDRKYVSRMNIRAKAGVGTVIKVFLRYDSESEWTEVGEAAGNDKIGTTLIPVRPRRCDHFELKISGTGDCRILSIAKVLEVGRDGR